MTVLVVGGAGYIGSHTCKALKAQRYTPIVYDNLQSGHAWSVKYGPLVVGDILDGKRLDFAFTTYKPIAVLHFASSINVRESMENPGLYYQNNVAGSLSLLQAMQRHTTPLLVFSSTAAVYGNPTEQLLSENHPCKPVNVYGRTKWMTEQIIHDFEQAHGFRSVIFRYFNAAGADPDGELGEAHYPETHLIPLALQTALGQLETLNIYGSDHATPDGTAIRDYIHVTDLAEAHVKALQWLLEGKERMTFNLGAGRGHSLRSVLSMVEKISTRPVKQTTLPRNAGEPPHLVADSIKARTQLQWTPLHSDLETIISTAHAWHQKEPS